MFTTRSIRFKQNITRDNYTLILLNKQTFIKSNQFLNFHINNCYLTEIAMNRASPNIKSNWSKNWNSHVANLHESLFTWITIIHVYVCLNALTWSLGRYMNIQPTYNMFKQLPRNQAYIRHKWVLPQTMKTQGQWLQNASHQDLHCLTRIKQKYQGLILKFFPV